jgi:hypothetical protein
MVFERCSVSMASGAGQHMGSKILRLAGRFSAYQSSFNDTVSRGHGASMEAIMSKARTSYKAPIPLTSADLIDSGHLASVHCSS